MNPDHLLYWQTAIQENPGLVSCYTHWVESLDGRRSPLADELPWMIYGAIEWLAKTLTQTMAIFEWGSGGSGVFFSQRARRLSLLNMTRTGTLKWMGRCSKKECGT